MGTRSLQAKIIADREMLRRLWLTHTTFNQHLPAFAGTIFRMMRGELGDTAHQMQLWSGFIKGVLSLPAKNGYDCLIKATDQETRSDRTAAAILDKARAKAEAELAKLEEKPDSTRDAARHAAVKSQLEIYRLYAEAFDEFRKGTRPLADARRALARLPNLIERKVMEESMAILRSHLELVELWKTERAQWEQDKAKWEADDLHRAYLAVRPSFESFESESGRSGRRSLRWSKYIEFLRATPTLAAWRGGPAIVNPIPEDARRRILRTRRRRRNQVESDAFFHANPELEALHRLHSFYERTYVRRRKSKRSEQWLTGFKSRPTFTLPDAVRHPRWFVFNAPQTAPAGYRNLVLPTAPGHQGSVDLRLLTGEERAGELVADWVTVRFRGDPRLSCFKPVTVKRVANKGSIKGHETEKTAFVFDDQQLRIQRPATISGVKLILRDLVLAPDGNVRSATPYLYFTCDIASGGWSDLARAVAFQEAHEGTSTTRKRKKRILPDNLVVCAVDLGIRNLGFATLARIENGQPRILRSRNLWLGFDETGAHEGRWSAGPSLDHIADHKRELRERRRMRGRPVAGEDSHLGLQEHIDHMGEDRFKRAARIIAEFALNAGGDVARSTGKPYPRADVLVMEKLANLIPQADRERGINRALVSWNRGQLVERLKLVAEDVGLRLMELGAAGSSMVCSRCGKLGRRYSIKRALGATSGTTTNRIEFGPVEKLFACTCGYKANADHNAAVNLQRIFALGDPARQRAIDLWNEPKARQREVYAALEAELRPPLEIAHGLDEPFPL